MTGDRSLPLERLLAVLPALQLVLGLLLAAWTLLFLFRIVLTWYPQVDLSRGLMAVVGWPTEPLLALTRRLVPPIGGVDVTPVIWVGLISLLRELLVGQQGLLTLVLIRSQDLAAVG
ncbi:YggT family protein [Cyanobium sp. ATX 6F1]|uniref:YggT family protein n=1 Tax=unclassified Cyanobium TaxID=2627006 RepID=UPI0020CD10D2|nr:YggT family protein [Cyanobium sp. ATX 6F1]